MTTDGNNKKIIAIIPARGGSKRIPHKNIIPLAGIPLLAHSILRAKESKYVQRVIVSTDDKDIAQVAQDYQAEVVYRPPELANDKASSESALLHVLDYLNKQNCPDPDVVVFLQCTSPLREANDIDRAIECFLQEKADSLFSASRSYHCIWFKKQDGSLESATYDFRNRKMEQDIEGRYLENGSIYVFRPEILRKYNNRLGGKISIYEMASRKSLQVDSPEDLELAEYYLKKIN